MSEVQTQTGDDVGMVDETQARGEQHHNWEQYKPTQRNFTLKLYRMEVIREEIEEDDEESRSTDTECEDDN